VKRTLWYIRYLQLALEKKAVPTLNGGFVGEREDRVRAMRQGTVRHHALPVCGPDNSVFLARHADDCA